MQERVLATLLNELDGIEGAEGVLLVAATNRPDRVDAALLRPGRLDQIVYVPPPADAKAREEILKIFTKKMPLGDDVVLMRVAEATPDFTGAELESLCREAAYAAMRETIEAPSVEMRHMLDAAGRITPALRGVDVSTYEKLHPSHCVEEKAAPVSGFGEAATGKPSEGPKRSDTTDGSLSGIEAGMRDLGIQRDEDESGSSDGEWC